jgi:hypothetical protein
VKKIVFIILAFQIISSGNFLNEIIKVNSLMEHFSEHAKGKNPLGLVQFIKLHYFDTKHQNSDPKRHASLPLYQPTAEFSIAFQSPIEIFQMNVFLENISADYNPTNKALLPQFNQVSVFQPPRFA